MLPSRLPASQNYTELARKLNLNISLGGAPVIVDDADQVRTGAGWAPGEGAVAHGNSAEEKAAIEPEDTANIGRDARF